MKLRPAASSDNRLDTQDRDSLLTTTRRLLVDLQAISSRISVLQEITTAINHKLSVAEILEVVGQRAKWLLDFDHCSICLIEPGRDSPNLITLFGLAAAENVLDTHPSSPLQRALQTKQSQLIDQSAEKPPPAYPSQLILPLVSEDEILGTLNIASQKPSIYTQEDLRIGYLLAMQLATAIRNAQRFAEIKQLYSELEQTYADLRQAEKLRDDLVQMVVHDLRNPLTTIVGYLNVIQKFGGRQANTEAFERWVKNAQVSSDRMMGLIDDLLNLNKLEAGQLKPNLVSFSMLGLLLEKKEMYQTRAEEEMKRLALKTPEQLPPVMADANLMSRALDNLLSNAFKYTDSGGHIEMRVTHNDDWLYVYVCDDGVGIPPEHRQRVFDKFAQVTNADGTSLRKGTGLGLAFCRLAIEAHGGKVWVESRPDKGSKFIFSLPLNPS